jgi:NAD(P)-dependent dehydrogenase (short-subunit alcohol dehydrogenase family)
MFDLTGRVALVAGGSRGIGKSFARQYVAHGGRVTIAARNATDCEALAAELNEKANAAVAWHHPFDLGDTASIDTLVDAAAAHWGQLDTLFCCSYSAVGGAAIRCRPGLAAIRCDA